MSEIDSLFSELNGLVEKHDYVQALQVIDLLEHEELSEEQREKVTVVFDHIHKR
jgi:uncharacterized protein YqgQ